MKDSYDEVLRVKCIDNCDGENFLTIGKVYEALAADNELYNIVNDMGAHSVYAMRDFVVVTGDPAPQEVRPEEIVKIDAHYAFSYELSDDDKKSGTVKIDPYFVARQWKLGSKDDSGVLFHCLKNISRFGDKNSREREIVGLFKQIKRLAQLEGVTLE